MFKRLAFAAFAATLALALRAAPAAAQKALVYCPAAIDGTGCNRIVDALGPRFAEGVDRGYDGSNGTVDLRKVDLQHYSVVVVPSLADNDASKPFALLREVAPRFKMAINGRVAVYAGAPDQGGTNRDAKNSLITNLATWASGGHKYTTGLVGLVAFLDLSTDAASRYDWVRAMSPADVSADAELQSFGSVDASGDAGSSLSFGGSAIKYGNMASLGLHIGRQGAVHTVAAATAGANKKAVLVKYSLTPDISSEGASFSKAKIGGASFSTSSSDASAATTSGPTLTTDKQDYMPGDTVTFSGTGFAPNDTVVITLHEDPAWIDPDRTVTAVADASGSFTNHTFVVDQHDFGVTFTATAVGSPSGLTAQHTFTDGSLNLTVSVPGVTINAQLIRYSTARSCSGPGTASDVSFSQGSGSVGGINKDESFRLTITSLVPASATFASWNTAGVTNTTISIDAATNSICIIADQNNAGGTLAANVSANVNTTTTVSSSLNASVFGQQVTFTATVTPATGTTVPVGNVAFSIDGGPSQAGTAAGANGTSATFTLATSGLTAGTHSVVATFTGTSPFGNSSNSAAPFSQTVNQAPLAVNADAKAKTFGAADPTFTWTYSGFVGSDNAGNVTINGTAACSIDPATPTNAGVYPNAIVCAPGSLSAANYSFATGTKGTLTINKANATIVLSDLVHTYDGTPKAATATVSPLAAGVIVTYKQGATAVPSPTNAGDYDVSAALTNSNYQLIDAESSAPIDAVVGKLTIKKADATLTATGFSGPYTGTAQPGSCSATGVGSPAAVLQTTASYTPGGTAAPVDAGTYTLTCDLAATESNYNPTTKTATITINRVALTVTADNKEKTFDGSPFSPFTSTIGGFVNNEGTGVVSGTVTYAGDAAGAVNAGEYVITPVVSGLTATNYTFTPVNGALKIKKADAMLTADGFSGAYTGTAHPGSCSATGVGSPAATVATTASYSPGGTTAPVDAGNYTLTCELASTETNYNPTSKTASIKIDKVALTVTADNKEKTFDNAPFTAFTSTIAGFVNNEPTSVVSGNVTYSGDAVGAVNAGEYVITPVVSGLSATNYSFTPVNGILKIKKADAALSATGFSGPYTGSAHPGSCVATGVGSPPAVVATTASYAPGGATAPVNAGSYTLTCELAAAETNYNPQIKTASITIDKVALTVTADYKEKEYDALPFTAFTSTIAGFVNSENSSVVSGSPTYIGTAVAAVNAGDYVITPVVSSLMATNYSFTPLNGTLKIKPKGLSIKANDRTKTYGQTVTFAGTEFTPTGLVNPQTIGSVSLTSAGAANSANVVAGGYPIVPSAATGGTFNPNNYTISYVNGTLTVDPAPLTITGTATPTSVAYPNSPTLDVLYDGFVLSQNASVLGGSLVKTVYNSMNAPATVPYPPGTFKVRPSGLTSSNYAISFVDGPFSVSNGAPVITSVTGPDPVPVGSGGTASASVNLAFTDPGVMNDQYQITSTWTRGGGLPLTFTSTTTYVSANASSGGATGSVTGTGLVPGVYSVVATVTDKFGETSEAVTYKYVVVYDPNGGFVTGGGWINSPLGALVGSTLTGKATFGFVSKYKKGQSTPDGDTEFQFQAAGLNFKSTSYEWLVIAGAKAQYKGSGTINGSGDYFFMLTAIDGSAKGGGGVDKFRIKIWNKQTGNIIYDNQLDAPDSSDPSTALGGGSIQIHDNGK